MFPKFLLIIFASCVEVTSSKKWLIDSEAIQKSFVGQDESSVKGKSCNYYAPWYMILQSEISINKTRSVCYFQPDFNILCHDLHRIDVRDPLGCKPKLAQAPVTLSPLTTTMSTQSFPMESSETEELTSWQCIISHEMQCNGLSMCLTDECQCADIDVFYCADGVGCIAHANVCDGMEDCRDGSDECMCDDVIHCQAHGHIYCVPGIKYCMNRDTLYSTCIPKTEVKCPVQLEKEDHPMFQCADDYLVSLQGESGTDAPFAFDGFKMFCKQHCDPGWIQFCGILRYEMYFGYYLDCPMMLDAGETPRVKNLCDGVIDCKEGLDEMDCVGQYYCFNDNKTNLEWISEDKRCDNKKDCSNGKDECDNCSGKRTAGVASDQYMVQGRGMRGYMIVVSVLTVTMNVCAGVEIYRKDTTSREFKVDKLFLITLCAYDALMGLCVGFTFFKSIVYSGNYCLKDYEWRTSMQCKFLGCCFTLAAHGSLLTVSMISLTRCYKVVFDRTIRVRVIAAVIAITFTFNALHSVLPIIPLSGVQDVFRASMTFSDNPFATEYNPLEMKRKYRVYRGENVTFPDTYTMLDQLNNISSKPGLFDPEELGYYSYSPLCIHNIYGTQASLVVYKMVYMSVIVTLLIATTISYITIICKVYRTSQMAQQGAANQVGNNNAELSIKVMFVIGSQLLCWITVVILMAVYGLVKDIYAPDLLYELTAIVFLPMNSFLNPVFNSSLYRKIMTLVKKMYSQMNERRTKYGNDVEPADVTINRNVGTTAM